jgi:hypothetical protein
MTATNLEGQPPRPSLSDFRPPNTRKNEDHLCMTATNLEGHHGHLHLTVGLQIPEDEDHLCMTAHLEGHHGHLHLTVGLQIPEDEGPDHHVEADQYDHSHLVKIRVYSVKILEAHHEDKFEF